jgi:hypothetical protein
MARRSTYGEIVGSWLPRYLDMTPEHVEQIFHSVNQFLSRDSNQWNVDLVRKIYIVFLT